MADSPDVQFFHRLKKHGIDVKVSTAIISSKKFTSEELEEWGITSLASLRPHDAISIIKNLHFPKNIGNKKSSYLCSQINNLKKSSQGKEEASTQGGNQGKDQANQCRGHLSARGGNNRGKRGGGPPIPPLLPDPPGRSLLGTPSGAPLIPPLCPPPFQTPGTPYQLNFGNIHYSQERKQTIQTVQTDQIYLNSNLDYLKGLSENAKGIQGFSTPSAPAHFLEDSGVNKSSNTGRKSRGNRSKKGGAKTHDKEDNSDEDSDYSIESTPDHSRVTGNRGLNRKYGSTGFLNSRPQSTNIGNQARGSNRGPRRDRVGSRGLHENSPVDISNDYSNQAGRSQSGNRGRGHGRGQGRGNQRGRGRNRGRHGAQNINSRLDNQNDDDDVSDSDSESDETSSESESEASRSTISGSQDLFKERLKDFNDKEKKRRQRRKPRHQSLNEEVETFEDERVEENKIFSYLVKSFGGFIAFDDFVKECDLIPSEFDIQKWFRCHKRRFKLFEKEGNILYISAFYRDVTLCLDYNCLFGRNKICSKTDCEHFHICKNYISGNCSFGETCRYSHSFRDASNLEHKKKLGLLEFSDKEMVVILGNRYPRICSDFLKTASCPVGEICPKLHMCSASLRGRCQRNNCPLGHSFETDHNKWVLQALEYHAWLNKKSQLLLKRLILFDRSLEASCIEETTEVEEQDATGEELKNIADEIEALKKKPEKKRVSRANRFKTDDEDVLSFNLDQVHIRDGNPGVDAEVTEEPLPEEAVKEESKSTKKKKKNPKPYKNKQEITPDSPMTWLVDAAEETPLCVKHVEGNCPGLCPRGHHHHSHQAPYVWQIKHGETWSSFRPEYSEEIEEGFCKHLEVIDAEILVDDHTVYMVHVCVANARKMSGVVYEQDGVMLDDPQNFPIRRLSTQCYVEVKDKKLTASPAFTTQWRWFWMDDNREWQLFDTENFQKTLERKYKYGQATFLFTRDNYRFKYRIDFRTFRQVNLDTKKTRSLSRRPLFVSLEDVTNKVFPNHLEVVDPISKPPNFVPWDLSNDFELVELDRVTPEFKTLRDRFFETLDNSFFDILYIYRVQNWHLYQDYELRKKNMKKEMLLDSKTNDVQEKLLFHGTDSMKTCQGICTNNFDFRTSGKNATVYGEGSYFAETSKYSHSYTQPGKNQERYMFRAKVLVGHYTLGKSSYRRPPERPGQTHKLYDSCVDNEAKPSMYIIFERSQSYPEYLIAYREKSTPDISTARLGTIQAVTTSAPAVTVTSPAPKPAAPSAPKPALPRKSSPISSMDPVTAPHQPIVYPSAPPMEASSYSVPSRVDRFSYPTASASGHHGNVPMSPNEESGFETYGQYYQDQVGRKRRANEYATSLIKQAEISPQQKKKDDGCVVQ